MEKKAKVKDQMHQTKYSSAYREASSVFQYINDLYHNHMIDSMNYLSYETRFKCVCFSKRFTRDVILLIIK